MRILCVIDSLCPGGAQRQIVELALGFKEKGHNVSFLTYHHIPFFNIYLEKAGILITCINESSYLKRLLKIRKHIRREKCDAILSFQSSPSFICELAGLPSRKWKLVVGERNADPKIRKSIKKIIFRWLHFFADYVVSNSHANIRLVHSVNPILSRKKLKVIPNIVDFNRFQYNKNHTYLKNSKLKMVIAARLVHQKNLNGLVDALILLRDDERDKIEIEWYVNSVTEPYYDSSIKEAFKKIEAHGLKNVISFYPVTSQLDKIIQQSDAIGLFSLFEGLPNAVCEAMACGKPVICSAVSDIPDFLSYNSRLLCDPTKPESIAQTIRYLINLTNTQLSEIGAMNEKIAKSRLNRDTIISDYLHLME